MHYIHKVEVNRSPLRTGEQLNMILERFMRDHVWRRESSPYSQEFVRLESRKAVVFSISDSPCGSCHTSYYRRVVWLV